MNLKLLLICLGLSLTVLGCSSNGDDPGVQKKTSVGYLAGSDYPDGLLVLPEPPKRGSLRQQVDDAVYQESLKYRGTPQWAEAARAEQQKTGFMLEYFSQAMGFTLSKTATPDTYALFKGLEKGGIKQSIDRVKDHYKRTRPYAVFKQHTCSTVEQEQKKLDDYSFPSSHATRGWLWALILSELNPARQNELLSRGYQYGQNRVICGIHWQSDVDAGRFIASYLLSRLHADPKFRERLARARVEIQSLLKPGS